MVRARPRREPTTEASPLITLVQLQAATTTNDVWSWDPERRLVLCVHRGRGFDVPVCLDVDGHRRVGGYVIKRLSEDVWRLAPSVCFRRRNVWDSRAAPFPDSYVDEFIALTHAPALINAELEQL